MFRSATAFNQDISPWDTSTVRNMGFMFAYTQVFNQDISSWDTSSVLGMSGMFFGALAFNQDISAWNVEKVIYFKTMFRDNTTFNNAGQPLTWNTISVISMGQMFRNATAFNQDIGGWNVQSVTDFDRMFQGATISDANYDALLIGWDAQNLKPGEAFDGGNSQYCSVAAQAARANIEASDGWSILDGGLFGGTCGVLGIEVIELDSILLYPNPTKGNFTITLKSSASYSLVSMLGQEIQRGTFSFGDNTLDISNFTNGLYLLNVKTSHGTATKKIIKQ